MASFMFTTESAVQKSSLTCRVHGLFLQSPTPFPLTSYVMFYEPKNREFCILLTTVALPSASKFDLHETISEPLRFDLCDMAPHETGFVTQSWVWGT